MMVRTAMEAQDLSVRDVADASLLSHTMVWKVARAKTTPSPDTLRALGSALGIRYTVLMRAAGYL